MRTRLQPLPSLLCLAMLVVSLESARADTGPRLQVQTPESAGGAPQPQTPQPQTAGPSAPQPPRGKRPAIADPALLDPNAPPITPGELTRLFDAYAVLQAQGFLTLDDDQYGEFVVRLKALQDLRRKHLGDRVKMIGELRKLTAPDTTATEASIRAAFDALKREDVAAQEALAKAYENLDSVLTVRQQARFRVFEEQIERQKLNLLSRVRRRAAPAPK